MSLDLIKSFVVGLGFDVDEQSLDKANKSINHVEKNVKQFNESSNKGFSETNNSLKDLFSLLSSSNTLGGLFPGLSKSLSGLILDLRNVKKHYSEMAENKPKAETVVNKEVLDVKKTIKTFINERTENNSTKNSNVENIKITNLNETKVESLKEKLKEKVTDLEIVKKKKVVGKDTIPKLKDSVAYKKAVPKIDIKQMGDIKKQILSLSEATTSAKTSTLGFKEGISSLAGKGGAMLKGFTVTSIAGMVAFAGAILAAIAAIVALIASLKKLISYMDQLGDKEIHYEKLSRQLWTTKENAEQVSKALDLLGISMEDLWLSPTLFKQFSQLRKDANDIKIPPELKENLKLVQDLSLEFKRFKQLIGMLFEWIGHYILETLKGPLGEFKGDMQDINAWLIEHIPEIAKVIGTATGHFLKFLIAAGKAYAFLVKVSHPFTRIFKVLTDIGKRIEELPDKTKKSARIIFTALALAFSPLLLVIALIDDIMTYFRGGESVFGDSIDFISDKLNDFLDSAYDKFGFLFKIMEKISDVKDGWDEYKENAEGKISLVGFAFSKLKKDAGEGLSLDVGEWTKYYDKATETIRAIRDLANPKKIISKGLELIGLEPEKIKEKIRSSTNMINEFLGKSKSKKVSVELDSGELKNGARKANKVVEGIKGKTLKEEDASILNNDEWSNFLTRGIETLKSLKDKAKDFLGDSKLSVNLSGEKLEALKGNANKLKEFDKNYVSSNSVNKSYMTNNNSSVNKTTNHKNEVVNKNNISVYSNDANQTGNVINKRLSGITTRNLTGAIE